MATTCPAVISCSAVIQLSRHFSNSAGLSAAKMALKRSCEGMPLAEVEELGQPVPLLASPGGDRDEVIGPGDDGAEGDGHDVDERIDDLAPAGVGQVGEMILEASRARGHDQKSRTTIRPSSTRLMSAANRTSRLSQITQNRAIALPSRRSAKWRVNRTRSAEDNWCQPSCRHSGGTRTDENGVGSSVG